MKAAAPRWLTRAQVGLAPPDARRLGSRTDLVLGVTVHHTGSDTDDPLGKWRLIQQLAMDAQLPSGDRYGDHPYNVGVVTSGDLDGALLPGRDNRWNGAHAASTSNVANRVTLGIALIGDGRLSPKARAAIAGYLWVAGLTYKRGLLVFDHQDWRALGGIATACPGAPLIEYVAQLRAGLRAGART